MSWLEQTRECTSEGEVLEPALTKSPLEEDTAQEYGAHERSDDTDDEGDGETTDRTSTEVVEDDTGDQRGQVGIEDGAERIAISRINSRTKLLAAGKFFLGTLVDKYVSIHSNTHGEHDTGNTRKGKHSMEARKDTDGEEGIDQEAAVGYQTSSDAIEEHHIDEEEHEGHDERNHTGLDGLFTESRTNYVLGNDVNLGSHLTRLEHVGQVVGLLSVEVTCDLRTATSDLLVDARSRINHIIKYDSYALAYILLGELGPSVASFRCHGHANLILIVNLLEVGRSINYDVATLGSIGKRWMTEVVVSLQCIELIPEATIVERLDTPSELKLAWEGILILLLIDEGIDGSSIARLGNGNHWTLVAKHLYTSGKAILHSVSKGYAIDSCAIAGYRNVLLSLGHEHVLECASNFTGLISLPELKVGRTLKKFLHTFGLLHARQLDKNTAGLLETLDVGGNYTETVDTVTEHVERVRKSRLHLALDDRNNFSIAGALGNLLLELIGAEDVSQLSSWVDLLVVGSESIDKVVTALYFTCILSISQCLHESGVLGILGSE